MSWNSRAEHRRAAVVEQHDVVLLRPVEIVRPARAGREASCRPIISWPVAERASTRRICADVLQRRHDLLDRGEHDVDLAAAICVRSPLPSLVTMIDVPVSAIRKFAPVMPTSAARKLLAQHAARLGEQRFAARTRSRSAARCVWTRRKSASTWSRVEMHGRRDDVARPLAAQLDDVFAEVGLDRRDAVRLEDDR